MKTPFLSVVDHGPDRAGVLKTGSRDQPPGLPGDRLHKSAQRHAEADGPLNPASTPAGLRGHDQQQIRGKGSRLGHRCGNANCPRRPACHTRRFRERQCPREIWRVGGSASDRAGFGPHSSGGSGRSHSSSTDIRVCATLNATERSKVLGLGRFSANARPRSTSSPLLLLPMKKVSDQT